MIKFEPWVCKCTIDSTSLNLSLFITTIDFISNSCQSRSNYHKYRVKMIGIAIILLILATQL